MDEIHPGGSADYLLRSQPLPAGRADVTVVIPTFCDEKTLETAARSALGQSLRDIELIIVDDASTDGTWPLIEKMIAADPRVNGIRHKTNSGKSLGMNHAITHARGDWLAVLDADDRYHLERLETLLRLAKRTGADMVSDNQSFYDAMADCVVGTAWPPGDGAWQLSFDNFLEGSNAYETFNLGMLKPVISVDFMRRTGLSYEVRARHGQDFFHLLSFFMLGGRAAVSDAPHYFYTQPFGMVSRQWSHTRRKRYDFQNACDINARYLAEAETLLTPYQFSLLAARNQRLEMLEYYYRAKESAMAGDYRSAFVQLFEHPRMLGYLFHRVYGRLRENPAFFTILHGLSERSRLGTHDA